MRDLPHHMKKLNRRIVRGERRMEHEEELVPDMAPQVARPKRQMRKQAKAAMKKEREERTPLKKTAEERNWEMKKRVPVFDRNNSPPKVGARTSKKKRPRI